MSKFHTHPVNDGQPTDIAEFRSRPLRVLLIEDNTNDALMLLRELRRAGFDVISERHQDALGVSNALDNGEWDIVISDYSMHNFTGADALEILKQKNLDLPFIIVSGTIGEETAVDAMRSGAQDFLVKRSLKRLIPAVERELREAENRRARAKTEEELRQSEDRFSKAFDASPIATVIFTQHDGTVLDANERFLSLFGQASEDVIGNRVSLLPIWNRMEDYRALRRQMAKQVNVRDQEIQYRSDDGQLLDVLISMERIEAEGVPCILAMLYDITERKQAENRLRSLQKITAALSEALTPESVAKIIIHEATTTLGAAAATVALLSEDEKDVEIICAEGYDDDLFDFWRIVPLATPDAPIATAIREKRAIWTPYTADPRVRDEFPRMDSHDESFKAWIALPMVVDSQALGGIGMSFSQPKHFDDETQQFIIAMTYQCGQAMQRARLYAKEQKARMAAEEANALKTRFLGMISHELRTPLASIKGFTSTLLAKDVSWDAEDQREFINTINEETDKLTDLVNQLLDVSRMQAGFLSIEPSPQDLMDILGSSMLELRTLVKHHHFDVAVPPDLPFVMADERRVSQVILNLVDNAAKYSEHGTQILLRAAQDGAFARIEVCDEGSGIRPEDAAMVFEPFQQIDRPKGFRQGAGLGLTICKGLIDAHGGKIWIESNQNKGTRVIFTLPLA